MFLTNTLVKANKSLVKTMPFPQEQRQRMYEVFMHLPAAICVLRSPDLVFELANPGYEQLVGAKTPLEGRQIYEALPTISSDIRIILENALKGEPFEGKNIPIVLDWENNNKLSKRYIDFTYEPMVNSQGMVEAIICFAYDVTEQVVFRERMALLSEVNANLAIIQDETATLNTIAKLFTSSMCDYCLIDMFDGDSKHLYLASSHHPENAPLYANNQELERAIDAYNRSTSTFSKQLCTPQVFHDFADTYAHQEERGYLHLDKLYEQGCHTVVIFPIIAAGKMLGMLTLGFSKPYTKFQSADYKVVEDIARQLALTVAHARLIIAKQEAREKAEHRLSTLIAVINSMPDAVYIMENDQLSMCNRQALDLLGFSSEEEFNQYLPEMMKVLEMQNVETGEYLWNEQSPTIMALQGTTSKLEVRLRQFRTKKELILRSAIAPIRYQDDIIGVVVVNTDITERIKAQKERLELKRSMLNTQRWESLGVLAGGIAHEFNNLFAGILGNAELLLEQLPSDSEMRPNVEQITSTSQRAAELTRKLLAYAGKGQALLEEIDLNDIIHEVIGILQTTVAKHSTIHFRPKLDLPTITADSHQMRQIITNLVMNAVEALQDQRGTIVITTHFRRLTAEELACRVVENTAPNTPQIIIKVADTGIGMDAEMQSRIFEPFFTTKFAGRGLGLAAVSGITRAHKGQLMLQSKKNLGTTMTVAFPVEVPATPTNEVTSTPVPDQKQPGSVLIIEDEMVVRRMVGQMLKHLGYTAIEARNGKEGIEAFREHMQSIQFILLDLTMPDLQGNEVAQAIWQIQPQAVIVVMSGYNVSTVNQLFPNTKPVQFLAKPFTLLKLRQIIEQLSQEQT